MNYVMNQNKKIYCKWLILVNFTMPINMCVFVCVCVCVCSIAQLCLILCDPMDHSPLGSSVHGIFPSKNTGVGWRGSSRPRDRTHVSCIAGRFFTTQPLGYLLILKKFPILSSKATMHLSIAYLSKMKTSTPSTSNFRVLSELQGR